MNRNTILKKAAAIGISAAMIIASVPSAAFAADNGISYEATENSTGNLTFASGVTEAMCHASYWNDKSPGDEDMILMTHEEIDDWNKATQDASGTSTCDIANTYAEVYDADYNRQIQSDPAQIDSFRSDKTTIYIDGKTENKKEYLTKVLEQVSATGYTETKKQTEYAVGTHRTALKSFPILSEMGWSATDCDDENQIAIMDVNEPMVIRGKAVVDGHLFYNVRGDNCNGWVDGEHIAICSDKAEWINAWQVDSSSDDFLVVTSNKIVLEKSHMDPELSEVKLTIGTVLKLVPEEDLKMVGERGTWNNYVVYLPTRDKDGMYEKKMALISQHYDVSVGYPDYTQANVLKIAFNCLGDRYGWGGSDEAMDCTLYTRLVYKCLGFQMPRNTTWQCNVPTGVIDMAGMSEDEKGKLLRTSPAGTLMYFSDLAHGMIYVGTDNETGYVISDTGTLYDTTGTYYQQYNVILNPLTVKRGNGNTWLANTSKIMLPAGAADIADAKAAIKVDGISVTYDGMKLYEGINYRLIDNDTSYTVEGINNFKGSLEVQKKTIEDAEITLSKTEYTYSGNKKNPLVEVTLDGNELEKNVDYSIRYADNINAGTATVTLEGMGLFSGEVSRTFEILPCSIDDVTIGKESFTYDDSAKDLEITNSKGYELEKNTDYTVKGIESTSPAGDYDVKITGQGNYEGSRTIEITVSPAKLSKMTFSATTLYCTGKNRVPTITVYAGDIKCTSDTSTLNVTEPSSSKIPGEYAVKASGSDNLSGTLSKTYKVKVKPTSISSKSAIRKGFKVTAKKQSSTYVTGYQVRYSAYKSMKNAKKTSVSTNNIRTIKNLKSKKTYYIQVRTYKTIDGKKYYSAWSDKKSIKTK